MPISRERFESGMSTQQYIDQIKVNKDPFVEIYNAVKLPSDAAEWVNGLTNAINLARLHRRLVRRRSEHHPRDP